MGHHFNNSLPLEEELDSSFDRFVVEMLYDGLPRSLNTAFLSTDHERREWHDAMLPELPPNIPHYCLPDYGPALVWGTYPNSWTVIQTRVGLVDCDVCFYPGASPTVMNQVNRITLIFLEKRRNRRTKKTSILLQT